MRAAVPVNRGPGLLSGAWAARAITGPPGLALAAWPWVAAHTALDARQALGACALAGAAGSVAGARRRGSRTRTAARLRAWRAARGELADVYSLDDVLPSEEGVWRLGPMTEPGPLGDYELRFCPFDGDPAHLLIVAPTGGGKSEMARALICPPLDWGWKVDVIDLKESSEFHPLPVHDTPAKAAALLAEVRDDLRRRGALLRDVEREVVDPLDGSILSGRHRKFRDVPAELRAGLVPRFVLIDEASLLKVDRPAPMADPKKPTATEREAHAAYRASGEAITLLQQITALGRSLGVVCAILIQRPDADLLPGFLKNNVQARLLLGAAKDSETQQMVLGSAVASAAVLASDPTDRPPGRIVAADVGGPGARLGQAYLVHEAALLRRARDAAGPVESPATAGAFAGPPVTGSPGAPAPSAARPVGSGRDVGYLPAALFGGVSPVGAPPRPAAGSAAAATPAPPSRASSSARRPGGALARAVLRVAAWRLLAGPLDPAPPPRPSGLRDAALAARPDRCAACRAKGVAVEVDHRRPRWARGSDRPRNLWLLCAPCHSAKTREEAIVRKWRRRADPRALARVPAPWWVATAVALAGALALGGILALIVAALLVVQGVAVMMRRSGLDGLNTLDARLEMAYGGVIAHASRVRTATMAGIGSARLVAGYGGALYLGGRMLIWFLL